MNHLFLVGWGILMGAAAVSQGPAALPAESSAEKRALAFLAREVQSWPAENRCFSCHNNGDGARVLYQATKVAAVPRNTLAGTTQWLLQPAQWGEKVREGTAGDRILARIQFASALAEAVASGHVKERQTLIQAAEWMAQDQRKDGSWVVDAEALVGSPTTYGTPLATAMARRVLQKTDPQRFRANVARADTWLRQVPVRTVLDAGAVLLALEASADGPAVRQQQACLEMVRKGQGKDGGWGPQVEAAAEPFDTAVVLLALSTGPQVREHQTMIQRGRGFLVATQRKDGSWPETTRPAGAVSYAQRLSTTAWATLALLSTKP